ncbi:MAG: hypothetical protein FJ100_00705 [Deltaproteobacteria bacterium]|nr:hypothetical protein [Deltaproteobacteria bacterium]
MRNIDDRPGIHGLATAVAATVILAGWCWVGSADAAPVASRSAAHAAARARAAAKRIEPRHSVVVLAARPDAGRAPSMPGPGWASGTAADGADLLAHAPNVRCEVCASTAAAAQPGQQSIFVLDLRSITHRLTTVQFRDATLKLTSFSPLGLQFRKPF